MFYDERAYFFKMDTTLKRIRHYLQKRFNESNIDLTVDQWVVLDQIYPRAGISQNELVILTAKDAPTLTRILDILVQKDKIERRLSEDDRRRYTIHLTQKGEELHQKALVIAKEVRSKAWGDLSEKDYNDLVRVMDIIYKNVKPKK